MPKTLYVYWHGLGDNILATPAIRRLKETKGDFIGWAMLRRFRETELMAANPHIDELHWISDAWNDFGGYEKGRKAVSEEARKIAGQHKYDDVCIVDHRSSNKHKIHRTAEETGVELGESIATEVHYDRDRMAELKSGLGLPEQYIFFHGSTGLPSKDLPVPKAMAWLEEQGIDLPVVSPDFTWNHRENPIGLAFEVMRAAQHIVVADSIMYHAAHAMNLNVDLAYFQRGKGTWEIVRPLHTEKEHVVFELAETSKSRGGSKMVVVSSAQETRDKGESSASCEGKGLKASFCIITNAGVPGQRHRGEYLHRLLKSIRQLGIPESEFEIIVSGLADGLPDGVRYLKLPDEAVNGHVCRLRNAAASAAKGDFIVQCDDDVLLPENYWEAFQGASKGKWDILCTRLLNPNGTRYWDWAAYRPGEGQTLLPYHVRSSEVFATGGHAVYRRDVFDRIKWNEELRHGDNEEYDLANQARREGFRYELCLEATVYLQYHHSDAYGVIDGLGQRNTDAQCTGFRRLMQSLGESGDKVCSQDAKARVLSRIAHKLSTQQPVKEEPSEPHCRISVLVCCYRYLQRFRLFAQSLCKQDFDLGSVEVVVANPNSPDGLSAYLAMLSRTYSETTNGSRCGPRFIEVLVDEKHRRNRGYLIQRAFEKSSGQLVVGMDCDLVLPPTFLSRLWEAYSAHPNRIAGIYRNLLTSGTTDALLTGAIDPINRFAELLTEDQQEEQGYRGILGYCQAVGREAWEKVGYPEQFDNIAKSDVEFVDRLRKIGVAPLFVKDVRVLHLHHPRDWSGTKEFL